MALDQSCTSACSWLRLTACNRGGAQERSCASKGRSTVRCKAGVASRDGCSVKLSRTQVGSFEGHGSQLRAGTAGTVSRLSSKRQLSEAEAAAEPVKSRS